MHSTVIINKQGMLLRNASEICSILQFKYLFVFSIDSFKSSIGQGIILLLRGFYMMHLPGLLLL